MNSEKLFSLCMAVVLFGLGLFLLTGAQNAYAEALEPKWKTGLRFGADGFKLKLGGRIMNDWFFSSADSALESDAEEAPVRWEDGTEFRRARLYLSGVIYNNFIFKAQYDFAGGDADIKDMYIGLKNVGVSRIMVGHFKEPFGLEELTSSKYITFMERSLTMEAFAPSRNNGLMITDTAWNKRLVWAIGAFKDVNGYGENYGDNDFNLTARIAAAPWKQDKNVFHLGIAYSARNPNGAAARFRSRPEAHMAPARLVDTGSISSNSVGLLGLESAVVVGPFSVQGEYVSASVSGADGGPDLGFSSYYVYASYFITGESRNYKNGVFGRVKPRKDFGPGAGAFEVAVRYSAIDLDDGGVRGGEETNSTVALNWLLNPNSRVMANYINADLKDVGTASITQLRFQVDF
ncbi:Phosphate/pyrophosphate-specific outer membrane porin OprP/OprO [hydrothermal vent metagenome]|uniref:Phosphate/pyrophosphate-specific outer membrane porin OprP/OprO n=1 Tax=hydrothermal vent metagenome TaxID=652676 RepID=A0A3B1BVX4_9ZZZZ